jgi:transcriptional regulator with XRE-family HTH domain
MPSDFTERLRQAREKKELTQSQLAERAGLQSSAISHFEAGRRSPSFDNLKRLADALGVTIDYLIGRVEEPKGSGPVVQQLFRDLGRMSPQDQEVIAQMAAMMAAKNKPPDGGEKK